MEPVITSEIIVAYTQCPRKAYLLLFNPDKGEPHEYVRILEQQRYENQERYLDLLKQKHADVQPYTMENLRSGGEVLINARFKADGFEAACGVLTKVEERSTFGKYNYEPTIFVGTHSISKEQKLEPFFVGHVLERLQHKPPVAGRIIGMDSKSYIVKLENIPKVILPLLEPLREWMTATSPELPPVILNKHCPTCQFQRLCQTQAEQEDNLSLLDGVTARVLRQYERKGIFTVKQLSFLFKPRKRKKRSRNPPPITHKIELQALAIRENKIYIQELPALSRQPVELFLDIEGVPDRQFYYLIGLLVCQTDTTMHYSFWADTAQDEYKMWQQFLDKVNQYPDTPIYHYGSYEPRAIATLAKRYATDSASLKIRLINVNSYIYGKVYFPVRSNRLKELGAFIGASWTSPDASGLQSLVWRYYWDETSNVQYKNLLLTYNAEDCRALQLLTDELSKIQQSADILSQVEFANQLQQHTTKFGEQIHSQFVSILKFAHANYHKRKFISFQQDGDENKTKKKYDDQKKKQRNKKVKPKATKVICVPQREFCRRCKDQRLQSTQRTSKRLIVDLVITKTGIKKTITEYIGFYGYCPKCWRYSIPLHAYSKNQLYSHRFKAWVTYQRVALRLPYESITEVVKEQFRERVSEYKNSVFIKDLAQYYTETEKIITQRLLESPFVHIDETPISIRGVSQYVWVFTDGEYAVFKLTETREATIVHEFLAGYEGTLISDFYPGYDAVPCRQQKCWVHLIRDLNNDLWAASFDVEFEAFVGEVRDLIIPIMQAVQKYGLRKRHLQNFRKPVDHFYNKVIVDKHYTSECVLTYQKRFIRYRESLFTFLEHDGIPWHNNTAENAIRHLAIQRDISRSFYESGARSYLVLLGIRQTCRSQGKSFFKFLFSGETDLDKFEAHKRKR